MTKDMTEGRPLKLIIGFAVPMLLGMLFQQCYNMVDTVIVGRFLGVQPLAGVGATGSLNFLIIGFCNGLCNGFAVPVAQQFGAKKDSEMRKYVANTMWLSIFFAIVITAAVAGFCRPILTLMDTPSDVFEYAYTYIFIIFLGIPCTILYNVLASIIRSLGDSKTPVVFLAVSSVINIFLDIMLIAVVGMGIEGAALATVISQGISGLACLWYMYRKFTILRMSKEELRPRKDYMVRLCYMGIPVGLQYSVTAIGSIILQTAINGFGSVAVASVTAASKIAMFVCIPLDALGSTMTSYAGQNMGAGKIDRIGAGVKAACLSGFVVSALIFVFIFFFGRNLPMLFLNDPDPQVLDYAHQYMRTTAAGYCLLTMVNVIRFTIQGMGFSVFAITAGALEMLARMLTGVVLVKYFGFTAICFGNVLAWIFADAFLIPAFFICRNRLRRKLI